MSAFLVFLSSLTLSFAMGFAHAADPLLEAMAGSWEGRGRRIQVVSGHETQIVSRTDAKQVGTRLFSVNDIQEAVLDETGTPTGEGKAYRRSYWIRPAASGVVGEYDFGRGEGVSEKITSQGRFDGRILKVEQSIGNGGDGPALVIRSETRFEDGVSYYSDSVWYDGKKLSTTDIEYRRL